MAEAIVYLGAQIWNIVPKNLNCSKSFNEFKKIFENGLQRNALAVVYEKYMYKTQGLYKD